MASFRFLHAADIHLDSPLKGLAGQEGAAAERIRRATRDALDQLVTLAIDESVDFLIVAGDLYDGDWRDYKTGLFFTSQMGRLKAAAIPVFLLHGNHDAESQITRRLELPDNVRTFAARKPETHRLEGLQVALHGQSFRQRNVTDNLVPDYPPPLPGQVNIGVLHSGLGGLGGHANYAPCSLTELVNKGYDYWALGHVHKAEVLNERPYVVFPGNLQGRHIRETGPKGATLVTVEQGEIAELEFRACDLVRWAELTVPLEDAASLGAVIDRLRDAVERAVAEQAEGRLLACRLLLTGRSALHGQLLASEEHLLAEAHNAASALGEEVAWIEKLVLATEAPLDARSLAEREDALGALQRMLQEAPADATLLGQIEDDIGELIRRLPHELRTEIEDPVLAAAVAGDPAALIAAVAPYLSGRLLADEA